MNISAITPKAHLLIVDDNPAHMTALSHTLMDSGYQVTAVSAASEALTLMRQQSFDLMLTDLRMPEMDGITLLRHAQELDHHLVGIVMTGHAAIDTAIEAMKVGALDYVLKPFKLSTIAPVLARALEVRRLRVEITQLQGQLKEQVIELEAANKELETFSYSVSHDLRAPLRAISGLSNVLVESYAPQMPDEAQQLLTRILASAERMGQLIEHLLRFSQLSKQVLNKRPIQIAAMAQEVLDELRKEISNQNVVVDMGELPDAVADALLLRQVFVNLLSNAFKFTRNNRKPQVSIGCQPQDGEYVYFVKDNGAGFDMRYAGGLFKVFHRLHRNDEFEGTGVGLSLVQRIIERHGGRIWAEAEVGKGAVFRFTLPVSNEVSVREQSSPAG